MCVGGAFKRREWGNMNISSDLECGVPVHVYGVGGDRATVDDAALHVEHRDHLGAEGGGGWGIYLLII